MIVAGTSIKNGGVKLVLWTKASPLKLYKQIIEIKVLLKLSQTFVTIAEFGYPGQIFSFSCSKIF